MIPQNSNWSNKTTVHKGTIAEQIIDTYLESKGYIVYNPTTDGAHAFDKLAIKNKENVIIAECKAKAKRNYYDDTGIDYRHYLEYKTIQEKYKIPVFIFFIDEMLKQIYGNFLSKLESIKIIKNKDYPSIESYKNAKKIIYFPIVNMRLIENLTDNQVEQLIKHSTRNYEYV